MRRTLAEQIRQYSPRLAEALEEKEFSDRKVADELRVLASSSGAAVFFTLMELAKGVDEL